MGHVDNAQSAIKSNTGQWTSLYIWWHGNIKHRPPVSWPWITEDGCLGSLYLTTVFSDRELRVDIMVLEHSTSFLLNTDTTYLILRKFWEPTSPSCLPIVMVGGKPHLPHQIPPINCIFRGISLTHLCLLALAHPVPLLGRDLYAKVGAFIF